jgi:DNA helicase-2/ATP-dependent DNA helicase PcrA
LLHSGQASWPGELEGARLVYGPHL